MKRIIIFVFVLSTFTTIAQNIQLERIEPSNWWVGMQDNSLQLMVHGENISESTVNIESKSVKLIDIQKVENPNYLFINLEVKSKNADSFDIQFIANSKIIASYNYKLLEKSNQQRGFSTLDNIYLLMPDRFANGNSENDSHPETLEKVNRSNPDGRHGGDIQGIINHLDYIKNLGMTAIWINPLLENNMKDYSYHGYAITDFYKTDPRYGTNHDYKNLVSKSHEKGLKIVMDIVLNHCGSNHWWMNDLPEKTWVNNNKTFKTSYRGATLIDPHASNADKERFVAGWFVETMPDLNQNNKFLANYLIQNILWWIEHLGIDGIRMDTQPYSYKEFVAELNKRIRLEYPDFTILGEAWLQSSSFTAYFQGDSKISGDYNSYTHTTTDFPLYYAIKDAFNEEDGWTSGLLKLYYAIAQDFLYPHPERNIVFIDNHDLNRFYSSVGEDLEKYKMGVAYLFTTRGIPMFYYGDEILMAGLEHEGHGQIRKDFPGGWEEDPINAFTKEGLDSKQVEAFNFVKKLANYRITSEALTIGKLTHFVPDNNVYVYFRHTNDKAVMVLMNNHNSESRTVDCKRFQEILKDYNSGIDVITGEKVNSLDEITVAKKSVRIIELNQ